MEISVLAAFLGGSLALLSPCGALLLPGYFASSVTTRAGLLLHGAVFFLGLVLTLVPLGVGAGMVGTLFVAHRGTLIVVTSLLLIVLGVLHGLGIGLDLGRLLPGVHRAQQASARGSGLPRTLLLGAVGGVAGFCAGPILGAVLTLAVGQGTVILSAVLLAVYGAGMVVPLMLLAALWRRLGARSRALLRGREFTVVGRRLHTTTVLTGALIITVGILFWATNGLVTMPSPVPTGILARWQETLGVLNGTGVQIALILLAGALALALWWRTERRR
ncbi:cytochrome c biogenesis CcdA family protein [uncultured Brachybacterium sp.]|uniref:cytochrome c biogenesis CcdA family protein n=1 Tax=uncultured Brachybacterium sp. TaxID=189680 RepID=UPI0026350930|nr:cytochrome c biogenesis CcdA family protein [uncultured Brachybacterium sp.]